MSKNYLLIYSEQLATKIELLCQNIKASSNTLFQIRKSSSSIYANICEANYGQSKGDMVSKFEIALKECSETEGWLKLLNALQEIAQKGYIEFPEYDFSSYGADHILSWHCTCTLPQRGHTITASSTNKKEAKHEAAYKMLLILKKEV